MNILSLFDGISCGRLALERAGILVDKYYASEIDKHAIAITQYNNPDTIQLGDVIKLDTKGLKGSIDVLFGGSPCQSLSITQAKTRQNLDGKSKLFFEFARILEEVEPKYFLLENVASMKDECKQVISEILGVEPFYINSSRFSAQDRPRYYWTNIPFDKNLPDSSVVLKDILEDSVDEKYFYNRDFQYLGDKKVCAILDISGHDIIKRVYSPNFKCGTLTTCGGGNTQKKVYLDGRVRKLTPIEYERLQTLPDNHTQYGKYGEQVLPVADSHRYTTCGNGWTADVIAHIFKGINNPVEQHSVGLLR